MALYDKASLVLIPSGTKAGTVYSQKPVPSNDVLGDELVTNGTFDTDSDWSFSNIGGTHGWRIADGRAICDTNASVFNRNMSSNTILEEGKTYILNLDILQSADNIILIVGSSTLSSTLPTGTNLNYSFIFKSPATGIFKLYAGTSDLQEIDNVSVRQVVDGDFDFTRSSYATRVNSQGLIEKERSNLLLQSNNFDTTWGYTRVSVSSGQSGYDGTNDAWSLISTSPESGAASHYLRQTVNFSGVHTVSFYLKAGTKNWSRLLFLTGSNPRADFDLSSNGTVHNIGGGAITADITDVGSGWYRCSITAVLSGSTPIYLYIAQGNNNTDFVGDNTAGIYIQDAQLEQGLVATDVIETTTSAVYTGITDNVPRLDYDGDCPSLLLEPARTNFLLASEYFDSSSGWSRGGTITQTDNYGISPDGKRNSTRLQLGNDALVYRNLATPFDGARSLYVKSTSGSGTIQLLANHTNTDNIFTIDENWQRVELSDVQQVSQIYYLVDTRGGSNTTIFDIEVWGAQYESGSYATSYIPTYGTSVTRNADLCNNAGDSTIFNDEEGVLYFEAASISTSDTNDKYISITDGTTNNVVNINFGSGNLIRCAIRSNGVGGDNLDYSTTSFNTSDFVKVAISWTSTNARVFINGTKIHTDSNSINPLILNVIDFVYLSSPFHGKVKSLAYFNRALTDTELADLTS